MESKQQKKELKLHLTNELIGQKYDNQFDLVNHAIDLAKNMVITGRDPRVKIETQNKAQIVLTEIYQGKNHMEELPVKVVREEFYYAPQKKEKIKVENKDEETATLSE